MANAGFPVYRHLVKLAGDGKLFHIDDTRVRILSCYREDKDRSEKERRATHTSGIVVKDMVGRKIALYFSGRRHAGENLDDVLERRSPSLPMPIKMSDAAAANGKKRAQTIDANCLAHGRGKFKELEEIFPVECGQVMEAIRKGLSGLSRKSHEPFLGEGVTAMPPPYPTQSLTVSQVRI